MKQEEDGGPDPLHSCLLPSGAALPSGASINSVNGSSVWSLSQ